MQCTGHGRCWTEPALLAVVFHWHSCRYSVYCTGTVCTVHGQSLPCWLSSSTGTPAGTVCTVQVLCVLYRYSVYFTDTVCTVQLQCVLYMDRACPADWYSCITVYSSMKFTVNCTSTGSVFTVQGPVQHSVLKLCTDICVVCSTCSEEQPDSTSVSTGRRHVEGRGPVSAKFREIFILYCADTGTVCTAKVHVGVQCTVLVKVQCVL